MLQILVVSYFVIGAILSTFWLYMLKDVPGTFFQICRDGINGLLFWPYILQLQYYSYQKSKRLMKDYEKNKEYYDKLAKELMDSFEKTFNKNDKPNE